MPGRSRALAGGFAVERVAFNTLARTAPGCRWWGQAGAGGGKQQEVRGRTDTLLCGRGGAGWTPGSGACAGKRGLDGARRQGPGRSRRCTQRLWQGHLPSARSLLAEGDSGAVRDRGRGTKGHLEGSGAVASLRVPSGQALGRPHDAEDHEPHVSWPPAERGAAVRPLGVFREPGRG